MKLYTTLDCFLSPTIRQQIEERYYARVNQQADLAQLLRDPTFLAQTERHVGLFSDHGVVHVRDVAQQTVAVLTRIHGVLIPKRGAARLTMMQGYGVLAAYWHDIGMFDFSAFGRAMHPEFAAHAAFDPELDDLIHAIWKDNPGDLCTHLVCLAQQNVLTQAPHVVLREMLALAMCHSKSKVPTALLNTLDGLRQRMIEILNTDLATLYSQQQPGAPNMPTQSPRQYIPERYLAWGIAPFAWLTSPHPQLQALAVDVIDTLRALRCADALRQRGAVLKTSGGYEIFVDQRTAKAIVALRHNDTQLFLLEVADPISAGEANIASSELDPACDLRISFHRGAFTNQMAVDHAATCAAGVIHDIQKDVIGSFERSPATTTVTTTTVATTDEDCLKAPRAMLILLEESDDNLAFAELVATQLTALDTTAGARVRIVPSLKQASDHERDLYLAAPAYNCNVWARQALLKRMHAAGHCTPQIDLVQAFYHVKALTLPSGVRLIEAGTAAAFVYIPLTSGLMILPLGGYGSFAVPPYMPLGATGVIRGAERNATVCAEATTQLLMIPKMVYLNHWHHTHTLDSFRALVQSDGLSL